ncbi:organic cation transporter protein-like [Gigantopelta aegis]|uniref:organic cation transporter protein-like n=1 Tax=Gigantopelta aegis TaxID=1735272 RepID=UPI001B88C467|nr:organic cation transporter protein-like [Gigantopelta aegis]
MKFNDLFQYIGDFGTYQKRIYFVAASIAIANAFQQMVVVFSLTEPKARCAVPGVPNDTYASQGEFQDALLNVSIPWDTDSDGLPVRSKCQRYGVNSTDVVQCDVWVYDKTVFEETATSEFDMICNDKTRQSHAKMMMFGGMMIGAIALGAVSDLFGRKKTLFGALIFHISFAIGSSFARSFEVFAALRFLLGIAHSGVYLSTFVIGMELVGPSRRALAGIGIKFYYISGMIILGGLAYAIRNWHYLHLAVSVPNILFLSFFC